MIVFMLTHINIIEESYKDTKLIGFFSSEKKAKSVIDFLKHQEGFRDYPDNFVIKRRETIGKIKNNKVYYLTHEYELENEVDMVSDLGVFSTKWEALKAKREWKKVDDEMKRYPKGFWIDDFYIDKTIEWKEGFFEIE